MTSLLINQNLALLLRYYTYDYIGEQNKFLEEALRNCSSTYCIVAGHHPIYSIGSHGPEAGLIDYLLPLMIKYKETLKIVSKIFFRKHGIIADFENLIF